MHDKGSGAIRSQSDTSPASDKLSDQKTGDSILLFNMALSAVVGIEEEDRLDMMLIVPIQWIATMRKLKREET